MVHAFADCELDRERYQLRRRGRVVKLEPKVFDVLVHLLEHRDRVVTKAELLDALWPGEALSESVLPRAIAAARRADGDTRAKARVIETVHGRGYRFVAELHEVAKAEPSPEERSEAAPPALAFVGRTRTLERLARALDATLAGRGSLVLVRCGVRPSRAYRAAGGRGQSGDAQHRRIHLHDSVWPGVGGSRAGREAVGRHDPRGMRRAGWTALGIASTVMLASAVMFFAIPETLIRIYSDDPSVVEVGVVLLFICSVFQLFDGLQTVTTGALRGLGDTRSPMVLNLIGHWLIGLPVGYVLCFNRGWGVAGLWTGLSVGLILIGSSLLGVWSYRSRRFCTGHEGQVA